MRRGGRLLQKGGSTAKLSLAVSMAERRLFVFDSFVGLLPNDEPHETTMYGGKVDFTGGQYCGSLNEVKDNVRRHGADSHVHLRARLVLGHLPTFAEPVLVAFIDVDLVSSTETCLKYYPLFVREASSIRRTVTSHWWLRSWMTRASGRRWPIIEGPRHAKACAHPEVRAAVGHSPGPSNGQYAASGPRGLTRRKSDDVSDGAHAGARSAVAVPASTQHPSGG